MLIGQGGVVIFVRHGGTHVRVHQSKLRKVNGPQEKLEETEKEYPIKMDENLFKTPAAVLDEEHNDFESDHEEMAPHGAAENNKSS